MGRTERSTAPRRLAGIAALVLLVALAVLGLLHSADDGAGETAHERAGRIAAGLRCPTCQGLSVKDSNSPMAGSMRQIVSEQIEQGRTDEQIRAYFVQRYSDWVLLTPPARSGGWLVWAVPVVTILVGAGAVLVVAGRVRAPRGAAWAVGGLAVAAVLGLALQANLGARAQGGVVTGGPVPVAEEPGSPTEPPPAQGSAAARLSRLQRAVEANPSDHKARLALAAEALTEGRSEITRAQADVVLAADPDQLDALLLRGLAGSGRQDHVGVTALRAFVATAPEGHPGLSAAQQVLAALVGMLSPETAAPPTSAAVPSR